MKEDFQTVSMTTGMCTALHETVGWNSGLAMEIEMPAWLTSSYTHLATLICIYNQQCQ